LLERGAEVILETARFWSSRAEWQADLQRYEINDIIGPDEYHDHVDNNAYTNALACWNLQTASDLYTWLKDEYPAEWKKLSRRIHFHEKELEQWRHVSEHMYIPFEAQTRLVEQFEGYFQRRDVNLAELEPRTDSVQALFGIEGANATQVLKQPDVLMLMYLLPDLYDHETLLANYAYYNARTDHTFGSSLGPSIQAIMACKADDPGAYTHFIRAARADLFNVRNNAGDGIHGASAGGLWQAVVFGFAGLEYTNEGWKTNPHLPEGWRRVAFKIVDHGRELAFEVKGNSSSNL
jgi:kojibiose phosphorylase